MAPVTGGSVTGIDYTSFASRTSVSTQGQSTFDLISCVDHAPGGVGVGLGGNFCGSPFASLTSPVLTFPAGSGGSVDHPDDTTFSNLTGTYALGQEITLEVAGGDSVNYSMSQALTPSTTAPVPEPMSVGLLGSVLLLTGRGLHRRRKQQDSISA